MSKRGAENYLTQLNSGREDDGDDEPQEFRKASEDVIQQRAIKTPKSKRLNPGATPKAPFSGFSFGAAPQPELRGSQDPATPAVKISQPKPDDALKKELKTQRGLNESFLQQLRKMVDSDPTRDLSVVFKQYETYRKEIEPAPVDSRLGPKPVVKAVEQAKAPLTPQKDKVGLTPAAFGLGSPMKTVPPLTYAKEAPKSAVNLSKQETPKATFSFGQAPPEKVDIPKPVFNFGGSQAAPAFGTPSEKKDDSKPAFSFGAPPSSEKKDDSKPAFTFGAPPSTEKKDEPPKSGFTFNAPASAEKKSDPKPAFTFGAPATEKKDEPPKPAFSFGSAAEKKDEPPKAGFTFGSAAPAEKKDEPPKAAFSFGAPSSAEKHHEPPQPAFSFGQPAEKKEEPPKASFTFGKPAENGSKPAFSFGQPTENGSKPAFSFGQPADPKPAEQAPASGFTFGAPTFSFTPTTSASVPGSLYNFASAPAQQEEQGDDGEDAMPPEEQLGNKLMKGAGEEQETTLHQVRAKLFSKADGAEFKVAGVGDIKLNRNNETGKTRILFRTEGIGKIILNDYILSATPCKKVSDKRLSLILHDENAKLAPWLVHVKEPKDCDALFDAIEKAKQ
ncbi:hypothetical protein EDD86DRAFT_204869, partial [Gorgonomyces haynaldii]